MRAAQSRGTRMSYDIVSHLRIDKATSLNAIGRRSRTSRQWLLWAIENRTGSGADPTAMKVRYCTIACLMLLGLSAGPARPAAPGSSHYVWNNVVVGGGRF